VTHGSQPFYSLTSNKQVQSSWGSTAAKGDREVSTSRFQLLQARPATSQPNYQVSARTASGLRRPF
jgi:hypothetical protein